MKISKRILVITLKWAQIKTMIRRLSKKKIIVELGWLTKKPSEKLYHTSSKITKNCAVLVSMFPLGRISSPRSFFVVVLVIGSSGWYEPK